MAEPMRFLALYGWPEDFDLARHPDVLARLVDNVHIKPNKLGVSVSGEKKSRNRTLYKKSRLVDVVAEFSRYDWIGLDEPINGSYLNVRSHLTFKIPEKTYVLAKLSTESSATEMIQHVQLLCEYVTPLYGFSHVEEGSEALYFPYGIASMSLSKEVARRVLDLGEAYRVTHEHLDGKMHDVYGLNVLSPAHLDWLVRGKPLRDWIGAGGRGDLIEIKKDVAAWVVPDDIRPRVRKVLFDDGALIATV